MRYTSLDKIVKNVLLRKGYPLHWYVQCLVNAKDCLRELYFDDLRAVQSTLLTVNKDLNTAPLPCDYVDWVKVGVPYGNKVKPLAQSNSITRLVNYDTDGNKIPYGEADPSFLGIIPFYYRTVVFNDYGENTGRLYGMPPVEFDSFKILPERNEIQLDERIDTDTLILEYISDGTNADAATSVDSYAQACIEDYIMWQLKEQSRTYGEGERERARQLFTQSRRIFRARKSDMSLDDIKRLIQRGTKASPK